MERGPHHLRAALVYVRFSMFFPLIFSDAGIIKLLNFDLVRKGCGVSQVGWRSIGRGRGLNSKDGRRQLQPE